MFFSTLIFVIAFLPLFTMRGVEGAIFSPMSHTYAYALATAILLAVDALAGARVLHAWQGHQGVAAISYGRGFAASTIGLFVRVLSGRG